MDKIIKVKDSQIETLLAFYEKEQAALYESIQTARSSLKNLEQKYEDGAAVIATLKGKSPSNEADDFGEDVLNHFSKEITPIPFNYPTTGSWWDKIKWVLNREGRVLFGSEVAEAIFKMQPVLDKAPAEEKKLAGINIFSTLSNKVKDNKLSRIKDNGGYRYGFNEWFDEQDKLLPQYDNVPSMAK